MVSAAGSYALLLAIALSVSAANARVTDAAVEDSRLSNYLLNELFGEIASQLAGEDPQAYNEYDDGWYTPPSPIDRTVGYSNAPTAMDGSLKWVNARRPEEEDHVVPTGNQYMSGGAGEGQQHLKPQGMVSNKQEVKTDANLPSYCSPPNPCPKGKTAADGCQESIPDTAEFNRNYILRQMQAGYCRCDFEHMDQDVCPQELGTEDEVELPELDQMLDKILETQLGGNVENPFLSDGEKRQSLTAKKGGQHVIMKRNASSVPTNPFLQGVKLPVVAKKSPHME